MEDEKQNRNTPSGISRNQQLSVDGVSMKSTNTHTLAQQDIETSIDINELKRRIERRDAENKRKDREVLLLQKEILNLTKDLSDLRDRNEQLQTSLTQSRLLTSNSRNDQENQLTNSIIQDLQIKLTKSEALCSEVMGENEVNKATIVTLKEQLIDSLSSTETRTHEIQSLKEELYSLNIKLKTLQIRLQEKDSEYEKLTLINETLLKSERQLKHQLEHDKTIIYEHERTINDLLATNKRMMATNLIKNETNDFLLTEINELRDGGNGGHGGGGGNGGVGNSGSGGYGTGSGGILTQVEMEAIKEIEKKNHLLSERNKELTRSIELHMDLLSRCENENNLMKIKLNEESSLREELQQEMRNQVENQSEKESTFQQLKKEVVKLRKENKILAEKCDELIKSSGRHNNSGGGSMKQSGGGGGGHGGGGHGGEEYSLHSKSKAMKSGLSGDERKRLKLSEETVHALRSRISFLLEQHSNLSQQSTSWNEQKLIFKSQISSLLEANISLRERLLTVQRSFMERSLYELDHPAVRRNAKPIFLTEGEEERVMSTGKWRGSNGGGGGGGGGGEGEEERNYFSSSENQFNTPEEVIEGAIVSHSLVPIPLKGLSQDPQAREARLLEYSMKGELGQPIPFTVEGFIERTLFDTLCAFTSGTRQSSSSSEQGNKSKHVMKPKIQKSFLTSVGTDGLYSILLEQGQYSHITSQADMAIRAEAEELLAGLQIPAFLKFVQTRPPEKFISLFTEKLAAILNFLRSTIHDYVNQLGESRISNAKLQSKISHSDQQVHFMKQQYSCERLSKQKNIMKYIREQLQLSDYKKLIYDISALGRDSLDEIDVQRRDLTDELRRENPSYHQMVNATHAERYQGLESQKLRGLMSQLRGVAEKLATTALHHFGDEKRGERDEIIGSIEIKLYDSQVDDETCHGIIGLLSGALSRTSGEVDQTNETAEQENDDNDDDEENRGGARGLKASLSRADKVLESELGITNSAERHTTASILAKSFLKIQSNYVDRLLLINLKDNCLTDISCKILCSIVEKSSSLRMLDIRGNMISSNGAKMLFDATRRNSTVLYVTQRQNGLMVEGHREIMGSNTDKKSQREPLSKSGVVGHRAADNREGGVGEEDREEGGYHQIMEYAAEQETALSRKHPLRIDIRDNNPEQMVAERLLEATEFISNPRQVRISTVGGNSSDDEGSHHNRSHSNQHGNTSQQLRGASPDHSRFHSTNQNSQLSSRPRPHSASHASSSLRPPRNHLQQPNQQHQQSSFHQFSIPARPFSGSAISRSGISGEGILAMKHTKTMKRPTDDDNDDMEDGDDDNEDVDDLMGYDDDKNNQNSYIRSKLIEKKNERLEGARGAGVGSLLDTEIRKMQIQSSDVVTTGQQLNGTSQKINPKKMKRKVIISNGMVRRTQPPPGMNNHSGKRQQPSQQPQAMTMLEKKKEMKGVYVTPVVRPINKSSGGGGGGGGGGESRLPGGGRAPLVKSTSESKGFVERKRIGITGGGGGGGGGGGASQSSQPHKLSLSRSAPQIIRPHSASAAGGGASLGIGGSTVPGMGHGNEKSNHFNPYTQRSLNPGILF